MRPKMTKIFLDQTLFPECVLYANRHTWRCWEMCSHNFGQNLEHFTEISFQKRSFWNWGNEMNKVDVCLGFVGAFEHFRRILVKFWRVSTFPVLLGLVCPAGWLDVCLSVRPS